ncbi:Ropporin-1-like protein [Acropora cervicornis]|uniref:Ropporin-1-like protein n=1 Tax=Acropora cervicornis TaxID=6130 RepID=A0AAD9QPW7_ACRCE|nr:Ropporin-1-like protein [Acropora cervicornis]
MPQPEEPIYCSQQINIPPELPDVLKQFTKAAIRTQPKDVLQWAYAYFDALSKGETPPLGGKPIIELSSLEEKWKHFSLPKETLEELLRIGSFPEELKWLDFLALACSAVSESLTLAMKTVCEILTTDLKGGSARIPFSLFKELYTYLAEIDGEIPKEHVSTVIDHLNYDMEKQDGQISPRNFMSDSCPPLSPNESS